MDYRIQSILTILLQQDQPVTSTKLALRLGVSSRTVKRQMIEVTHELEKRGFSIISSRAGYAVQISDADRYQLKDEIQLNMAEKTGEAGDAAKDILLYLLSVSSATIDEMAVDLHYSRNTVFNKIRTVKQELENFELELESKPHQGYKVKGKEFLKRRCMAVHFSRDNVFVQHELKRLLKKELDYDKLLYMFTMELKQASLIKSTEEVQLFLKYMIVSVLRQNKVNEPIDLLEESLNVTHLRVASQVLKNFHKEYQFKFNEEEHLFLTMVLGGGSVVPAEKDKISESVDNAIKKITIDFNEEFKREAALRASLITHISSTCKRLKLGIAIINPLKEMIQSRYFMATYYAYILAEELNNNMGLAIDDSEVAYLALHFEASMEGNGLVKKLNVLVVCGGGIGTSTVLKSKLESNFPQLLIADVLPYYMLKNRDLSNIDFIISTNNIEFETGKKVIRVNPILNEKDSERLLETIRYGGSKDYIRAFSEKLFFANEHFSTRDECLLFLTNRMIEEGLIDSKIQKEVMLREEKAPTEIGDLTAIPHCVTEGRSQIAVLILNEPIQWKNEKVQLVFFGCINPKEKLSKKYFPQIYKKVSQISWVNDVIGNRQFEPFIKRLTT